MRQRCVHSPLARHAVGWTEGIGLRGAWSNPVYVYICISTYIYEKYNSYCEKLGKKGGEFKFCCAMFRVLSQSRSLCDGTTATATSPCHASFPESWARRSVRYQGLSLAPVSQQCYSSLSLPAASPRAAGMARGLLVDFRPWENFTVTAKLQFNADILASYLLCLPST